MKMKHISILTLLSMAGFIAFYSYLYNSETALVFAIAIFAHEMGHMLALDKLSYKVKSFYFTPFGGVVVSEGQRSSKDAVLVKLAGPFIGVIPGIFTLLIGLITKQKFYFYQSSIVFLLNAFNLFPIIPLDGGSALRFAAKTFGKKVSMLYHVLALIFSLGCVALGVFSAIFSKIGIFVLVVLSAASTIQLVLEVINYKSVDDEVQLNLSKKESIVVLAIVPFFIALFTMLAYLSFLLMK